jgi:hypothetical protein
MMVYAMPGRLATSREVEPSQRQTTVSLRGCDASGLAVLRPGDQWSLWSDTYERNVKTCWRPRAKSEPHRAAVAKFSAERRKEVTRLCLEPCSPCRPREAGPGPPGSPCKDP